MSLTVPDHELKWTNLYVRSTTKEARTSAGPDLSVGGGIIRDDYTEWFVRQLFSSQLAGEHYCRVFHTVYGMETVALRYFNVFGPRQDPSSHYSGVISRFIDAFMKGTTPVIYGDGEQSRDFTFIANVVDANIKAAASPQAAGEVMNVANGERVTLNELAKVLGTITGKTDVRPDHQEERKGDVKHSQADNRKAVELIGYEKLVGLEEGLRRTIDWWKTSRFAN